MAHTDKEVPRAADAGTGHGHRAVSVRLLSHASPQAQGVLTLGEGGAGGCTVAPGDVVGASSSTHCVEHP